MRKIALLAVASTLTACASTHSAWFKDGSTAQDFYMDRGQCNAQAMSVPGAPMMQAAMVFNSCMQGKGWYLRQVPN